MVNVIVLIIMLVYLVVVHMWYGNCSIVILFILILSKNLIIRNTHNSHFYNHIYEVSGEDTQDAITIGKILLDY